MREFHTAKMDNQDKQDNLPPLNAASASTLTQTASASTSMPTQTASPATSTPTQTMSVSEVLQRCGLQEQADTGEGKQGFDEIYPATDPYGLGAGPHGNRHRDVGKFITFHAAQRTDHDEQVVSIGGIQFRAAGEQKIPLDKIGPQQYMEGSLAILRDLIVHDNMALPRVLDHVNYLIQIARFSQTFPWQSVLRYDAVYRREQSNLGFRWGTCSPAMMQTQLHGSRDRPQPTSSKQQPRDPNTGHIICQRWNGVHGCHLQACRFAHVCKTCYSSGHPHCQHDSK